MLTKSDKILIKHCFSQGVSAITLANRFKKTRQTIYTVLHDEIDWFGVQAIDAFELGVKAERLVQELSHKQEDTSMVATTLPRVLSQRQPFHKYHLAKIQERKEKVEARRQVLARVLNSLTSIVYDGPEVENMADGMDEIGTVEEALSMKIARNIRDNLDKHDKRGWRFPQEVVDAGYVMSRYSQSAYNVLRELLPFPSRQTISAKYSALEQTLCTALQDVEAAHVLIEKYLERSPRQVEGEQLQCTLAIDAFSINIFKAYNKSVMEAAQQLKPEQREDFRETLDAVEDQVTQGCDSVSEEERVENVSRFNSCFLIVLIPFRWDEPHVVLSLFPAESGNATEEVIARIFRLISICSNYNIKVRTIATDGDPGYCDLHSALSKKWLPDRHKSFETILETFRQARSIPYRFSDGHVETLSSTPIADPLHALKIARSRVLRRRVFITRSSSVSESDFKEFRDESWCKDRTQIGRMSDYHALMMFSPRVAKHMILDKNYAGFAYVWGWTCLHLVIRIPCLTLETRQALLIACFHVFIAFLNKILDGEFKHTKVNVRFTDGCDGVTFFETYYLIRVIHLVFAMYVGLSNDSHRLRMSAFGTHANENLIGRARVGAAGANNFPVFLRHFAKTEITRMLEKLHGIPRLIRTRDNIGGTKLDLHDTTLIESLDIGSDTAEFIKAFIENDERKMEQIMSAILQFVETVIEREGEAVHLYEPNKAANSGIMARLISFSDTKQSSNGQDNNK